MAVLSNVGLFGTSTRTNTLIVVHLLEETHASEIARILDRSLSRIQDALESLERAGVVVGNEEGKMRRIRLNPRYFARTELTVLLSKLAEADPALQSTISQLRRRPRRSGKEI